MNLEDLTEIQLQRLCIKLGMGIDLFWGKEVMLYLIGERRQILDSNARFAQKQLDDYKRIVDNPDLPLSIY